MKLRLPLNLRVLDMPSFGSRCDSSSALLSPPTTLPLSLRELRVHPWAVKKDRLCQWTFPSRCVISVSF